MDELPNTITNLVLGKNFDNPINKLPDSIIELKLSNKFYSWTVEKIPKQLKKLSVKKKSKILFDGVINSKINSNIIIEYI